MKLNSDYNWFIRDENWYLDNAKKRIELASLSMITKGIESYVYPVVVVNTMEDIGYIRELMKGREIYARLANKEDFHELWEELRGSLLKVLETIVINKVGGKLGNK